MASTSLLQKHPLLRLLLPLGLGIWLADAFYETWAHVQGYLWVVTLFSFCLLFFSLWKFKRGFALFFHLTLIGLGMLLTGHSLAKSAFPFTAEYATYRVVVIQQPEEKERSVLCSSVVLERVDTLQQGVEGKNFLLYLEKDSAAFSLAKGDSLLVYAQLEPVASSGIPDAFDYARYLRRKGVSGSAYVPRNHWKQVGHQETTTLSDRMEEARGALIQLYQDLGFQGDELAVLSALTVGEKEELTEDIQEVYSISGASHVLAISGLHIGLLYMILWLCCAPLRRRKSLRILSIFLIIGVLWGFALLTGFPVSVVRSVIMFSLMGISTLMTEKPHTLNTLATAAFVMLLCRPLWLFEVGFQMSFAAVASIVLLHPLISSYLPVKNRLLRRIRDLFSVSIAAQIGVAPLVAFYFHRFSVYFLLTNFWVIPMVSVIMYVVILMLVCTPFPALQQGVALLLDKLLHLQHVVLERITLLPMASVERIWLDVAEVLGWYVVVWLCYRFLVKHTARRTLWALGGLFLLIGGHWWIGWYGSQQPGLLFYNVRGCPAVHLVSDSGHSWIAASDSLQQVDRLLQMADPYWMHHRMEVPQVQRVDNQLVSFQGKRICLVNDDRWRRKSSEQKLAVDYLYVSTGYRGTLSELQALFDIKEIILDASLSDFYRERLEKECASERIPVRHLEALGMVQIPI